MRESKLRRELLRKLFHLYQLPTILGYIVLRFYFSEQIAIFTLTVVLMVILEYEFLRLEWKVKIPDPFKIMRHKEKSSATGMLFFIIALIISFAVFDFKIALVALLLTIFGDMASAIFGIKYGKRKLKNGKSVEGFVAGFLINLLVATIFLWEYPIIVIAMAFTASLIELFTSKLDDNLTVPIFSGFVGHTLGFILGTNLVQLTNPIQDLYNFLISFF